MTALLHRGSSKVPWPFGTEHIDSAIKRFVMQVILNQSRQSVMAVAKVHGFGCHIYLRSRAWMDHSADAISAMRTAEVAASIRTTTSPLITSIVLDGAVTDDIAIDASASSI